MSYSKGIFWLDDCRIPYVNEKDKDKNTDGLERFIEHRNKRTDLGYGFDAGKSYEINNTGRFTPNLLVCDDMLNDGNVVKKTKPKITQVGIGRGVIGNHNGRKTITKAKEGMEMLRSVGDGGTNSRFYDLDLWFDKMLERL